MPIAAYESDTTRINTNELERIYANGLFDQLIEPLRFESEKTPVPEAFTETYSQTTSKVSSLRRQGSKTLDSRVHGNDNVVLDATLSSTARKRLNRIKGCQNSRAQKPVAFDLGVQVHHVQQGMTWQEYRKDIETYLAEMYAKVPIAYYQQSVRFVDGQAQIWFGEGESQTRAIESYAVPAVDMSMPEWYRQRAQRDVFGTQTLEKYLAKAKLGDSFMDISPAPFDISTADKEKFGFGTQSFLRVYTLAKDKDGKDILKSYARRLEVDPDTLVSLFQSLTGEQIASDELLGTVRGLDRRFDFGRIQRVVQAVESDYARKIGHTAPEQAKIQDISQYMKILDRWNYGIYLMMKNPLYYRYQSQIQTHFQKMEMAFVDLHAGKLDEQFIQELMKMDPHSLMDRNYATDGRMADYIRSRRYVAGFACDAAGSSFGNVTPNTLMTYQRLSQDTTYGQEVIKIKRYPPGYWQPGKCRPDGGCGKNEEGTKVGPCQLCMECEARYDREEKWKKWLSGSK